MTMHTPFRAVRAEVEGRGRASLAAALAACAAVTIAAGAGPGCAARRPVVTGPYHPVMARGGQVDSLGRTLDALFDAEPFGRSQWAVLVQSTRDGAVLYARQPASLMMPASNTKVVTTSMAGERLGWDFRFETRLAGLGPVAGGVLAGDLLVVGGGDPTINSRGGNPTRVFEEWADRLRAAGVGRIAGRIVGDGRAFPGDPIGQGWSWDYLGDGYAAPVTALQYNENLVELVVRPGASEGSPAVVSIRPPEAGMQVAGSVVTVAAGGASSIGADRLPGSTTVRVRGRIPAGAAEAVRSLSVADPTLYFVRTLRRVLVEKGIEVGGEAVDVSALDPAPAAGAGQTLHLHKSAPLSEVATPLMKVSQNLYAETLLRTIGLQRGEATPSGGLAGVRETLTTWGVPPDAWSLVDGSGLSRYNYLSPEALVRILGHIYADPKHRDTFIATLPVAGKDGGTVARRMRGTAAEGNAKAKTGSIANVRALSGYVTTRDGETLVFSILANAFTAPASVVDQTTDKAVVALAEFRRR